MQSMILSTPDVGLDRMMDASSTEHAAEDTTTTPPPAEHLGAGIVVLWIVMGSALVATAIVAFGWRRTLEVWLGAGVVLGLICVAERVWYRHKQRTTPGE
jgi:hypothetical protein